jgi:hypothetical protein
VDQCKVPGFQEEADTVGSMAWGSTENPLGWQRRWLHWHQGQYNWTAFPRNRRLARYVKAGQYKKTLELFQLYQAVVGMCWLPLFNKVHFRIIWESYDQWSGMPITFESLWGWYICSCKDYWRCQQPDIWKMRSAFFLLVDYVCVLLLHWHTWWFRVCLLWKPSMKYDRKQGREEACIVVCIWCKFSARNWVQVIWFDAALQYPCFQ